MLAAICVAALVVGTVAAMALTQNLRKEGPIASEIRFKAKDDGYRVCFRMPRDDVVDVEIVESGSRDVVKVLAEAEPLSGGPSDGDGDGERDDVNAHCFDWDATDESGAAVGTGVYRLRVTLNEADRSGVSGERIRIGPPTEPQ